MPLFRVLFSTNLKFANATLLLKTGCLQMEKHQSLTIRARGIKRTKPKKARKQRLYHAVPPRYLIPAFPITAARLQVQDGGVLHGDHVYHDGLRRSPNISQIPATRWLGSSIHFHKKMSRIQVKANTDRRREPKR